MAGDIVDVFEAVEIHVEAAETVFGPGIRTIFGGECGTVCQVDGLGHLFAEEATVRQSGEMVVKSVMEQFSLLEVPGGECAEVAKPVAAANEEEDIAKDDPSSVFKPSPWFHVIDAEDGVGEKQATQDMIDGDGGGGHDEDLPIEIERKEGERAEDMEVGLDAAAGEVDKKGGHEHLRNGDGEAGDALAGGDAGQQKRREGKHASVEECHGEMGV